LRLHFNSCSTESPKRQFSDASRLELSQHIFLNLKPSYRIISRGPESGALPRSCRRVSSCVTRAGKRSGVDPIGLSASASAHRQTSTIPIACVITFRWQKGLDFSRKRSVSVAAIYGSLGPTWILPRWLCRHCGASVVTALDAVATEGDPTCRTAKPRPKSSLPAPNSA